MRPVRASNPSLPLPRHPNQTHQNLHTYPHRPPPTRIVKSQHKLNTARLLSKTLHHVTTHLSPKLLRSHLTHTHQSPSSTTIYLFPPSPGSPAVGLSELKESLNSNGGGDKRNLRLVVFDGMWKHAKEMVKTSQGVLEGLGAIRVCLDLDVDENSRGETIYNDELLLRKEPFKGCVTTFEAVARCLRVVEPDNGEEIQYKHIVNS